MPSAFWDWRDRHSRLLGGVLAVTLAAWVAFMTYAFASIGETRRHTAQRKCDAEFRLARTATDTLNVLLHTDCEAL